MAGAGAPGGPFGGVHNFMPNAQEAGLSDIVRDLAALNLQTLHFLRANVDPADVARVDAIAEQVRTTLAAGDATRTREQATRVLQPITRIPAVQWGANANVGNIRMHNVPTFTGTSTDSNDVIRWLGRIRAIAETNGLTFDATMILMVQGSSGSATDYIEQMRDEGKTIHQVVQQLEMRYGDLCTPEEARAKCNTMPRKEKETLPEFLDRLRSMARMATRYIAVDAERRTAIDQLVEGNIRRILPTSVRNALEERMINRSRMGLPAFTSREVEKECLDLEKRRDERRQASHEPARRGARAVKQVNAVRGLFDDFTDEDSSSGEEVDTDDEATYHLINEIKHQEKRYAARGQAVEPQQVYRRAFRRFNEKYPPPKAPRNQYNYRPRQAGIVNNIANNNPVPPGPPNRIENRERKTIYELLALANCTKGHCVQCGSEGHYMHSEMCALKDKPLVDQACAKCGKGLHSADNCPRVYQQPYVAPPLRQAAVGQANVVEADALNDM